DELDVVDAGGSGTLAPVPEHLGRDVGCDDVAVFADDPPRGQSRLARACSDVEDMVAGLDPGHLDEPFADRRRRAVDQLLPVVPALGRGAPAPALTCAKLAGIDLRGFHRKLLSQRFFPNVFDPAPEVKLRGFRSG